MNVVTGRHAADQPDYTDGARSVACHIGSHKCDGLVAKPRRLPPMRCECPCHAQHRGKP